MAAPPLTPLTRGRREQGVNYGFWNVSREIRALQVYFPRESRPEGPEGPDPRVQRVQGPEGPDPRSVFLKAA